MSRKKIVVTIVAILVSLTGITAISVGAQPGSPLYPFKSIVEAIQSLIVRVLNLEEKTAELGECFEVQEVCDGVDQPDCFGMTEDDLMQTCGSDEGECHKGIQLCEDGSWGPCIGSVEPTSEVCDEKDNDCDGEVDEGCETPVETICDDGIDNDADGLTDCDDDDCLGDTSCQICGDGYCTGSENAGNCPADCPAVCGDGYCTHDENGDNCPADCPAIDADGDGYTADVDCDDSDPDINPGAPEFCDGLDNDCDGETDEDDPQIGAACDGADTDLCNEGTISCSGGALICSDNTGSNIDLCNGVDDDCDAASADGSEDPLTGTACDGPDSDLCNEGTNSCIAGSLVCSDNTGDNIEVCDGLDNDCDGMVDEGCGANGDACSIDSECLSGNCVDGVCCDTACDGTCEACVASKTGGSDGTCAYIVAETDPDDECPGLEVCSGYGTCTWTCFGLDKDNPSVCSGHGECVSQDTCVCDAGWTGADCSVST